MSLTRSLGLTAVAEGVETADQVALLREIGFGVGQGFHFARPQPAEEIERVLTGPLPPLGSPDGARVAAQ
jgi:EAL domain-containing protein (putative c-di-GMP-specific phosphodiesterase class I)